MKTASLFALIIAFPFCVMAALPTYSSFDTNKFYISSQAGVSNVSLAAQSIDPTNLNAATVATLASMTNSLDILSNQINTIGLNATNNDTAVSNNLVTKLTPTGLTAIPQIGTTVLNFKSGALQSVTYLLDPAYGEVGAWQFDNNYQDASGNGNTAVALINTNTLNVSYPLFTNGLYGSTNWAATFNAAYTEEADPGMIANFTNQPFSVSFWFQPNGSLLASPPVFFSAGSPATNNVPMSPSGFEAGATASGAIYFISGQQTNTDSVWYNTTNSSSFPVSTNAGTYQLVMTTNAVLDSSWHFVAFTATGTNLLIFVDGGVVGTTNESFVFQNAGIAAVDTSPQVTYQPPTTRPLGNLLETNINPAASPFNDFIIAGTAFYSSSAGWSYTNALNGFIDDFRIYNRTLSMNEIGNLFTNGPF